jgi:23S rRNA pseudouridine2605 synthase
MPQERLQKSIARSVLCSRREADRMIQEERVTVNGRVARLGDRVDPERDHIKVDGKLLARPEPLRYLLLFKPRGVVTTCDDPEERTTVIDLIGSTVKERIFPVGRLDFHSEGLIVLTNDGDLAARLTHPRYGVVREYMVKIRGDLSRSEHQRLMRGTTIEGVKVRPKRAQRESVTRGRTNSWWRIGVTEGRTHEVRELFFRAGHHVQRLRRTAIGPIRDDELRPGEFRMLTDRELRALKTATKRPLRERSGRQPKGARAARSSKRSRDTSKRG